MLLSLLRKKIPLILERFIQATKMAHFVPVVILVLFLSYRKYGFLDDWLLNLRHKSVIEYVFGIRDLVIIILNMMYGIVLIKPYDAKSTQIWTDCNTKC